MELQSIEYKFKRDTSRSIIEIEIKPRPFEMTLNWNQLNGAELKRNSIRCQPPAAAPFLWATTFGLLIPAHCVANSVDFLRIYWWIYEKIASCCCHCCCGNKTFKPPLIPRPPPPLCIPPASATFSGRIRLNIYAISQILTLNRLLTSVFNKVLVLYCRNYWFFSRNLRMHSGDSVYQLSVNESKTSDSIILTIYQPIPTEFVLNYNSEFLQQSSFFILLNFFEFPDAFRRFNLATISRYWSESDTSNRIILIISHTISTNVVLEYISEFLQQSSFYYIAGFSRICGCIPAVQFSNHEQMLEWIRCIKFNYLDNLSHNFNTSCLGIYFRISSTKF